MKYSDKTQILISNESLFKASIEEFSNKLYSTSSTNEIIKNSGINRGSFYYRFSTKEELFIALCDYIIVVQIDLYNQRKNIRSSNNTLKNVIFELFLNLYLLKQNNELFFNFITQHLYDQNSLEIIKNNCIEPLYFRLKKQVNLYSNTPNFVYIVALIDNLYHNFPQFLKESNDIEKDLDTFIDFILVKPHSFDETKEVDFLSFIPSDSLSYILTNSKTNLNYSNIYSQLFDYYKDLKIVDKELKRMSKLFFLSYDKLIINLIKRSFKDISHYKLLLKRNIIDYSKIDKEFFNFFKVLLYLSIKEKEYIIIDQTLDILCLEAKKLICQDILPILSKTSKIVLISSALTLDYNYENLYLVDNLNQVKKLDSKKIQSKYLNSYEVSLINEEKIHYKLLSSSELKSFIVDNDNLNSLVQIKFQTTIDYSTIIRNEVIE